MPQTWLKFTMISLMSRLLLFVLFVGPLQSVANDDTKRSMDPSFSGRKHMDRLRSRMFENKNNMSSLRTTPNRAIRRLCFAQCIAFFSFSEPLDVSNKCLRRVNAYECSVDIVISYDSSFYTVYFIPQSEGVGLEAMGIDSIMGQEIVFRYAGQNNKTHSIMYYCRQGDECEWNYVQQAINKFKSTNFQPVYDVLATLLYDSSGSSVDRCYEQSSTVACSRGLCRSFYEGETFQARECANFTDVPLGIEIESRQASPALATFDRDYFSYVCNRDLCNSPSVEATVQSTIIQYASVLGVLGGNTTAIGLAGSKFTGELSLMIFLISTILVLA